MDVITAQLMIQGTIKIGRFHVCVKIIQQLTSETCQGYFFGRGFSFRFLHRHSGFASGHCNGTVAIEFHPHRLLGYFSKNPSVESTHILLPHDANPQLCQQWSNIKLSRIMPDRPFQMLKPLCSFPVLQIQILPK